jgi:hypothetical protein
MLRRLLGERNLVSFLSLLTAKLLSHSHSMAKIGKKKPEIKQRIHIAKARWRD